MHSFIASCVAGAASLAALCSPAALAGGGSFGVNIDLNPPPPFIPSTPSAGYGAASGQAGFWNNVRVNFGGSFALTDINGAPSGVGMTRLSNGLWDSSCVGGIVSINWSALMCDYAFDAAGVVNNIEYTFTGLPAGTYQIYTYGARPGETFVPPFFIGLEVNGQFVGGSGKSISGPVLNQQFNEGVTHVVHTITIDGNDALSVLAYDTSGEFGDPVSISGIQIVGAGDPTAAITSPGQLQCACSPVQIFGTANVGQGAFSNYRVEWSADGNDPWNTIAVGAAPVTNGLLATWDTEGLAEGWYLVRLTAQAVGGKTSTAVKTVYLDKAFSPIQLGGPQDGDIVGGLACFSGTVTDLCFDQFVVEYRASGSNDPFQPVDPSQPVYTSPAVTDTFAIWDTSTVPDGLYEVRVLAATTCGEVDEVLREIEVDNTLPVVQLSGPANCTATGCGPFQISGIIQDANLESWVVQYAGGDANVWTTIAQGSGPVAGVIASFDPQGLPACCYAIRVIANDEAIVNCNSQPGNQTERVVAVKVGLPGDVNGDGAVNALDLNEVLGGFGQGCP